MTRIRRVPVRLFGSSDVCRSEAVEYSMYTGHAPFTPGTPSASATRRRDTPSRNSRDALFGLMRTISPLSRSMMTVLLSSMAFMMPYCTPMSTTANPMPDANSASRTFSWVRFFQASGTGGGRMYGP